MLGVSSIVLLGLGLLYVATMSQTGDAVAEMAATDQATGAFADMEFSVRNAVLCDLVTLNGVTALRCKMPSVEVDLNGDGTPESYAPASFDAFGCEKYALGKRVWYYLADSTGVFGTTGTTLWRSVTTSDTNPTASSVDLAWSCRYGVATAPRFTLVKTFAPTVDATNLLVSLSLTVEGVDYASHRAATGDSNAQRRGVTLLAQTFWGSWRT